MYNTWPRGQPLHPPRELPPAAAPPAAQDPPSAWYGPEYQQCSGQPTVAIVDCVLQQTVAWERRLVEAYQALSATLDSESRHGHLQQAQHRWTAYREANCGFYAAGPGSISRIHAAECQRVMTANRARELEQAARP